MLDSQRRTETQKSYRSWATVTSSIPLTTYLNKIVPFLSHDIPTLNPIDTVLINDLKDVFKGRDLLNALEKIVVSGSAIESRNAKAIIICNAAFGCKMSMKVALEMLHCMTDVEFYDVTAVSYYFNRANALNLLECLLNTHSNSYGMLNSCACLLLSAGASETRFANIQDRDLAIDIHETSTVSNKALQLTFKKSSMERYAKQSNCTVVFEPLLALYTHNVTRFPADEKQANYRITHFIYEACFFGFGFESYLYDLVSIESPAMASARRMIRSTAIKYQNLDVLSELRRCGFLRFDRVVEDRGFTFPTKKQSKPAVLNQIAQWIIQDHTATDGNVNVDGLLKTLSDMPKSASIIMLFVIEIISADVFWSNVKSINVVKKVIRGSEIDIIDALSQVKNASIKVRLMPLLLS